MQTKPADGSRSPLPAIFDVVRDDFAALNDLIPRLLTSDVQLVEEIGRYIVESGGKRLRPLLVLLSASCCREGGERFVKLAAVIELLHTAMLLHDDVIDESALRRGRPTANSNWGNAPSVLVGDFLYSRAFQLMADLRHMDVMALLADATNQIAQGEVDQLSQLGNAELSEQRYMDVIRSKTAVLFQAASETAAVLACARSTDREALRNYGLNLGLAFQLIDDVLDYTGDANKLGKNVGDDLAEGKLTLPLIYTLAHGSNSDISVIRSAIEHRSRAQLEAVIFAVQRSGALDYARTLAQRHTEQALCALASIAACPAQRALSTLANFAVNRTA